MSRGRIIVLDDDPETRDMLRLALESSGYEVSEARSGIRLISSLHVDRPDLVLMDTSLSWTDGVALCRAIKSNPAYGEVPVMFLSAQRHPEDVSRGLAAGATDYFPKPLGLGALLARIREVVAWRREQA